jgi:hypothetical protein
VLSLVVVIDEEVATATFRHPFGAGEVDVPRTASANVVEPNEMGARAGRVVNLANWTDVHLTGLAPHEPEPTEIIVMLEAER